MAIYRWRHFVPQMKYFSGNDTVAVMEATASFFRVYNAESMQLKRQYDIKVGIKQKPKTRARLHICRIH